MPMGRWYKIRFQTCLGTGLTSVSKPSTHRHCGAFWWLLNAGPCSLGDPGPEPASWLPDSLWPHKLNPTRLLCPWDFSEEDIGMVAMLSSRESSQPRDQTHVSCVSWIGRQSLSQLHHLGSPPSQTEQQTQVGTGAINQMWLRCEVKPRSWNREGTGISLLGARWGRCAEPSTCCRVGSQICLRERRRSQGREHQCGRGSQNLSPVAQSLPGKREWAGAGLDFQVCRERTLFILFIGEGNPGLCGRLQVTRPTLHS